MITALFVETQGVYYDVPGIDPWGIERDAMLYTGSNPVVAHRPCQRWGRFWHGSPRKPHQFKLGDDQGAFEHALATVRRVGGVLEHPADRHAWGFYGLAKPRRYQGWIPADSHGGFTCYVEQGHYGHARRKPTWLYRCHCELPRLNWSRCEQRLNPVAVQRHGYEKARRIGIARWIGGKDKTKIRERTPIEFRDVLLSIAATAKPKQKEVI